MFASKFERLASEFFLLASKIFFVANRKILVANCEKSEAFCKNLVGNSVSAEAFAECGARINIFNVP